MQLPWHSVAHPWGCSINKSYHHHHQYIILVITVTKLHFHLPLGETEAKGQTEDTVCVYVDEYVCLSIYLSISLTIHPAIHLPTI